MSEASTPRWRSVIAYGRRTITVAVVAGSLATGIGAWRIVSADTSPVSSFVAMSPQRILDTRFANPFGTMQGGGHQTLQVGGRGGVPGSATAVVLNLTVTNPTQSSYLTAWPTGERQPDTSIINWVAGRTIANLVTIRLGSSNAIDLYNYAGAVDVIADVAGYYVPGTGAPGPKGDPGASVLSGASDPAPSDGSVGDLWFNTATAEMWGPKQTSGARGGWGASAVATLHGPAGDPGPQGPAGATVRLGTTAPGAPLGNDGDVYINTTTGDIYGPKSGGAWGAVRGNLTGPAGPSGVANVRTVQNSGTVTAGAIGTVTASCGAQTVLSGGWTGSGGGFVALANRPNGSGWTVTGQNTDGADQTLTVSAVCADAG